MTQAGAALPEILAGDPAVDPDALAVVLDSVRGGRAAIVGVDRNAVCHRVPWPGGAGAGTAIVKSVRYGAQRTNADTTFTGEASVLARLPAAGLAFAPRLIARVRSGGEHFLLMSELPGVHPDPVVHPLADRQLAALVDALDAMDRAGLMHYDLKPANILVTSDEVAVIDFEFSRFDSWRDCFGTDSATFHDDFNAASNPHFPGRSNFANFEFRTLSRYCTELAGARGWADADAVLRGYLAHRAERHVRQAEWLAGAGSGNARALADASRMPVASVRARLAQAAAFERLQAELLRDGDHDVVAAEASLMALRRHVFERDRPAWQSARTRLECCLGRIAARVPVQGTRYAEAIRETARAVERSVHPGTRARVELE